MCQKPKGTQEGCGWSAAGPSPLRSFREMARSLHFILDASEASAGLEAGENGG